MSWNVNVVPYNQPTQAYHFNCYHCSPTTTFGATVSLQHDQVYGGTELRITQNVPSPFRFSSLTVKSQTEIAIEWSNGRETKKMTVKFPAGIYDIRESTVKKDNSSRFAAPREPLVYKIPKAAGVNPRVVPNANAITFS